MKQEVREPAIYNAIITAIAAGSSRMSEISTKVGENSNVCSNYMKNLINLGIIRKETPYGEKESRKSIYVIEDNMFYFWYRFVLDNNSAIARGAADCFIIRTCIIICFPSPDLRKDAWIGQKKWEMWRWLVMRIS